MPEVRMSDKPVCDFCSSGDPRWEYPASDFPVDDHAPRVASVGAWLACAECAALIEQEQWPALAKRGLQTPTARMLKRAGVNSDNVLKAVARIHQTFRHNRQGERRALEPG